MQILCKFYANCMHGSGLFRELLLYRFSMLWFTCALYEFNPCIINSSRQPLYNSLILQRLANESTLCHKHSDKDMLIMNAWLRLL